MYIQQHFQEHPCTHAHAIDLNQMLAQLIIACAHVYISCTHIFMIFLFLLNMFWHVSSWIFQQKNKKQNSLRIYFIYKTIVIFLQPAPTFNNNYTFFTISLFVSKIWIICQVNKADIFQFLCNIVCHKLCVIV